MSGEALTDTSQHFTLPHFWSWDGAEMQQIQRELLICYYGKVFKTVSLKLWCSWDVSKFHVMVRTCKNAEMFKIADRYFSVMSDRSWVTGLLCFALELYIAVTCCQWIYWRQMSSKAHGWFEVDCLSIPETLCLKAPQPCADVKFYLFIVKRQRIQKLQSEIWKVKFGHVYKKKKKKSAIVTK